MTKVGKGKHIQKAYSKPCQTSKMELFAKIINDFKSLAIFAKYSI